MTIAELLNRGVANIIPDRDSLQQLLDSGKKLNIYLGIDPTSTHIHLGHAFPLRRLQALVDLGHNVTFLIGDFTALIGDTSDKDSERPILTPEQILANFETYKAQASKLLDFTKVKIAYNSLWLRHLTFQDIIQLTQQYSLNDFISRELISKRLKEGKSIRLDEVIYPIMQGYDSYHLDTDIQLGGTDQTFNMQAGRTLIHALKHKESFIITNPFLTGTDGRKMSKSWGNAIWLDDTPQDIYGKVMSIKDDLILEYFTLATNLPQEEVNQIALDLKSETLTPLEAKKKLALTITTELHSAKDAQDAAEEFASKYQQKQPEDFPWTGPASSSALATITALTPNLSNSERKRLFQQGSIEVNSQKITDPNQTLDNTPGTIISIGKHILKVLK